LMAISGSETAGSLIETASNRPGHLAQGRRL
jgi:hypothetical protein